MTEEDFKMKHEDWQDIQQYNMEVDKKRRDSMHARVMKGVSSYTVPYYIIMPICYYFMIPS